MDRPLTLWERAELLLAEAQGKLARQRELITRIESIGQNAIQAKVVLATMQETVRLLQADAGRYRPEGPRRRVLIADDSEDVVESLGLALELEGQIVRLCTDERAVIALINSFRPDLLVLDLVWQRKLAGLVMLRQLRQQPSTANLWVAVVSGQWDPATIDAALSAGADRCFAKPVSPEIIAELVNRVDRRTSASSEPPENIERRSSHPSDAFIQRGVGSAKGPDSLD